MGKRRVRVAVLIGAGASYGAGDVFTSRPPLGKDLFVHLRIGFPQSWGRVPLEFAKDFQRNFEDGMHALWAAQPTGATKLLIDLGRFFADFRIRGPHAGQYTALLKALQRTRQLEEVVFASLNYEILLEDAIEQLGFYPQPHFALGGNQQVVVLKPHGSFNYVPYSGLMMRGTTFENVNSIYDGPGAMVSRETALVSYGSGLPPIMSLFAPGKFTPVAPRLLDAVRQDWDAVARASDVILTIGVHPNFADDHVWGPVARNTRARILYVGGKDPLEPYNELRSRAGNRFTHVADYFDEAVPRLQECLG